MHPDEPTPAEPDLGKLPPEVKEALGRILALRGGAKALKRAFAEERSFLVRSQWIESIATQQPDFGGEKVPWFNYAMVRLLRERVRPDMRIFEYGSGFSTLWWAKHARSVAAVEHHDGWAAQVSEMIAEYKNASLEHVPLDEDGEYCRAVRRAEGEFSIVVVDGRDRVNCMWQSLDKLTPDGIVLFDNSQREKYRPAIMDLRARGWRELQLSGLAPMTWVESYTSLLYRPENCFGL
ncbi:hypothetical protein [Sphingomonas sp. ID0503]|uniref:hypothetical protein n=1 Tax=Sphingomonas sp. ID0503 TaxID=3399691 RepID=UPI003AFA1B76